MNDVITIILVTTSYLLGAVPFGLFFGKIFSGIDVRTTGSGNIGATNVLRSSGKTAAVLTLIADMLKGTLPVILVRYFTGYESAAALAGAASILGHNFPIYLGFKGGKGVATGFGVILGMTPIVGLLCLLIWLSAALIWRYSSLSALIAFTSYPPSIFLLYPRDRVLGSLSLFIAGLVYLRHRENIKRLLTGTEPRIGERRG